MKRNQNGVSMISLVITIIVIIILAAVAFSSSTDTITNANFSTFSNNVGEVRTAFSTVATTIKGQEAQNNITRTDAQVFNFVAKGSALFDPSTQSVERENSWLPRAMASYLACTQISGESAEEIFDMKLPRIRVNTDAGTGIECSYFVTREGVLFVWPPYEYQDELYVNETTKLFSGDGVTPLKVSTNEATGAGVYAGNYSFKVGNVTIITGLVADLTATLPDTMLGSHGHAGTAALNPTTMDTLPTVFYTDAIGAASPLGVEGNVLFTAQ